MIALTCQVGPTDISLAAALASPADGGNECGTSSSGSEEDGEGVWPAGEAIEDDGRPSRTTSADCLAGRAWSMTVRTCAPYL